VIIHCVEPIAELGCFNIVEENNSEEHVALPFWGMQRCQSEGCYSCN